MTRADWLELTDSAGEFPVGGKMNVPKVGSRYPVSAKTAADQLQHRLLRLWFPSGLVTT